MSAAVHSVERRGNGWALVQQEPGKRAKTIRTFKTETAACAALNVAVFGGMA